MSAPTAPADLPPVEIIGPFSVWPRPRRNRVRTVAILSLAVLCAAIVPFFVIPQII